MSSISDEEKDNNNNNSTNYETPESLRNASLDCFLQQNLGSNDNNMLYRLSSTFGSSSATNSDNQSRATSIITSPALMKNITRIGSDDRLSPSTAVLYTFNIVLISHLFLFYRYFLRSEVHFSWKRHRSWVKDRTATAVFFNLQ